MGKREFFRGLSFHYKVSGVDEKLTAKFKTIDEFLETEFPKNNNPMSPQNDTEIFDILWRRHRVSINNDVKTLSDLKNILSGDCYVTNTDIKLKKCNIYPTYKGLERKSTHSIEEIRELIKNVLFEKEKRNAKVNLDGDLIKGNSQRLQTFFTKGIKCSCCGIEGKYFAKEKRPKDVSYHLNLYAVDKSGNEVLMTKDHIVPKSKGGKDYIDNYQTMCVRCNKEKGNKTKKIKRKDKNQKFL